MAGRFGGRPVDRDTMRYVLTCAALVVAVSLCLATARPAIAGDAGDERFAEGLAAYDGGDFRTSFESWRPLAEAGNLEAQLALAGLYMGGLGVARNPAEAIGWYRRAAAAGDPVAQLNLGDLYDRGELLARDPARAYAWFSLAAAQGRRWAAMRRDRLAAELTPGQRVEADRLIARTRPAE